MSFFFLSIPFRFATAAPPPTSQRTNAGMRPSFPSFPGPTLCLCRKVLSPWRTERTKERTKRGERERERERKSESESDERKRDCEGFLFFPQHITAVGIWGLGTTADSLGYIQGYVMLELHLNDQWDTT